MLGGRDLVNPELFVAHPLMEHQTADIVCPEGRLLVRPATVDDALILAGIITNSFHRYDDLRQWFVPLLKLGVCEDLRYRLRSTESGKNSQGHHACFVACLPLKNSSQSLMVGTIEVTVKYVSGMAIAPIRIPYISNLAVDPAYRRLGIASKLLQRCEVQVKRWNYGSIGLHVLANNEGAMELYQRSGYQVHHTERTLGSWFLAQPQRFFLQKNLSL